MMRLSLGQISDARGRGCGHQQSFRLAVAVCRGDSKVIRKSCLYEAVVG